ncbi:MAG TPA: CDP-alcohol phosphatidyltransferase [Chitinophagaceae bacterium]|nr:CDP-alcohol phosphatidyltransferase [Chitinophagaceae bacterium]
MEKVPLRIKLQKAIYVVIDPFVKGLIKLGLTPNMVTMIGFVPNIGVAVIFIEGGERGNRGDLSYVGWAGALVLFAGLFDMLDGQVARLGKMSSSFGAMFDSVLDRYSELIMFLGICYYLIAHHYFFSSLFAFIAMIGSMMVSYTRARAEGLGIECKDGLMQRPERIVLIGVSAIACGIAGEYIGGDWKWYISGVKFHVLETMSIFTLPLTVMAVLTNITAINRLRSSKKALDAKDMLVKASKTSALPLLIAGLLFAGLFSFNNGYAQQDAPSVNSRKTVIEPQDTFPVPRGNSKQLFYLQRTANTNTIICELKYNKNGELDEDDPVHVFWIRYPEGGQKKELSYIQRVFAYGIKSQVLGKDSYKLHFVSYKKRPMYLMRSPKDNQFKVYTTINNQQAVLNRIFIKVDGGTFWSPNVVYMEMKGVDEQTGKEVMQRFKP